MCRSGSTASFVVWLREVTDLSTTPMFNVTLGVPQVMKLRKLVEHNDFCELAAKTSGSVERLQKFVNRIKCAEPGCHIVGPSGTRLCFVLTQ